MNIVPAEWMPACRMQRVHFHWTAGAWKPNENDLAHYHILVEDDGELRRGVPTIDANEAGSSKKPRAHHTLNANSGAIAVSLCCMGDDRKESRVKERPFFAGPYPLTRKQWETLPLVLADLCQRYGIPVTPKTVLSHAEVQENLGIRQKGKWDIAMLAFDTSFNTAKKCGDAMRAATTARMIGAPTTQRETITHVVQKGETLFALSRKYGVSIDAIVDENDGIEENLIYPKQMLIIPAAA